MRKEVKKQLPKGWALATVGDVCAKLVDGSHNPPPKQESGFPMLSARNIVDGRVVFRNYRYISDADFESENARTQIEPGDVLLTIVGTIGRSAVVPEGMQPFALQRSVAVLKTIEIQPKYCMYQFQSPGFQKILSEVAKGTAQKGVYLKVLSDLPFIVAPLAEQQRIVEEIETQFSRVDAGIRALTHIQANLQKLRSVTLKWACEGKLAQTEAKLARLENRKYERASQLLGRALRERRTQWETHHIAKTAEDAHPTKNDNWKSKYIEPTVIETKDLPKLPEGWGWATVHQLSSFERNSLTDGPFGSNLKTEHYTTEGPRVIRLQNIGDGVFNDVSAHISREHFEKLRKHEIFEGEIVIAALGGVLPRACILPLYVGEAIVKADCIRFKPNLNASVTAYLNFALNSEPVRTRTAQTIHGVGRPRLNLSEIKSIALPLPPIAEQQRIASEVERRLSIINSLENTISATLQRSESLRGKILENAFEGKLTEPDRNDEPVSLLLERIRDARHHHEDELKNRRKDKSKRMKKKTERSKIMDLLRGAQSPIRIDHLFSKAGFKPEQVEAFYAELKIADDLNEIRQDKKDNGDVFLTAIV